MHCEPARGRSLLVWMMRSRKFRVSAAIGWLRVVRPGSVIGPLQGFLCRVQRMREAQAAARRTGLPSPAPQPAATAQGGEAVVVAPAAAAGVSYALGLQMLVLTLPLSPSDRPRVLVSRSRPSSMPASNEISLMLISCILI